MMRASNSRLPRALAVLLAIGGLFLAGAPARAQAPIKALETYNPVDANGVNLLGGSMTANTPTISIGPKGGGLSYSRSYDSSDSWHDSVRSMVAWSGAMWPAGPDPWYTVSVMGKAVAFKRTGDTFAPSEGDNATLVLSGDVYTLTLADGTVATYSKAIADSAGLLAVNDAFMTKVVQPNGRTIDFVYGSDGAYGRRLQSIVSSDGYQLHFDYVTDTHSNYLWYQVAKVTALNNAVDACAPTALTCSYSRTWPSLTFSSSGNTDLVTDALGRTTTYFFDGLLSAIRRPGRTSGYDVQVYYNGESQMVEMVTTDQGTYTYAIPDAYKNGFPAAPNQVTTNSATQVTDPLGHVRTVTSRSILVDLTTKHRVSRLRSVSDDSGRATIYGYDSSFHLTSIAPNEGLTRTVSYDARGNISQTQAGDNIVIADYPTTCDATNFRICNQPQTVTDARGGVTTFEYDAAHGGVVRVTSPAPTSGAVQPQTRTTYAPFQAWYKNASGAIVQDAHVTYLPTGTSACATLGPAVGVTPAPCIGTADEVKTATTYQSGSASAASNLLPVMATNAGGDGVLTATQAFEYNDFGDVQKVDGPLAGAVDVTRTFYDNGRQVTGVVTPDPDGTGALLYRATRTTYNADGQVTSVETGTTTDQSANAMATFSALSTAVTTYDVSGRKTGDSLVAGGVTQTLAQYGYDADNRLICSAVRMYPTATQPASACTPTTTGADGADRVTYTEYDRADRVTKITSGYGGATPRVEKVVTYFLDGREKTVADGKGNLTTYEYDTNMRLAKVRYPVASGAGSSTADYDEYGYDASDNRTSWRRRDGTTMAFTYDALNRAQNGLRGEAYAYDNLGRTTSATYAGQTASATFDALGRMKTETTNGWTMSYQYDLAGRRTRITWPDAVYVDYAYDLDGEVVSIRENASTYLATFGYDDLGRRSYLSRGSGAPIWGGTTWYGYDGASRLTLLGLDLAGTANDQNWTFTYNAAGQVKSRTASNSLYEWSGTQASKTYTVNGLNQYATAAGATIGYDGRGNLTNDGTKAYGYDLLNNLTSAGTTSLAYEPIGRLWAVTSGGTSTGFVYSGSDLVAEVSGSGQILRRYVPGPGTDEPIVWYEGATTATPRWLVADPQGSIVSVTNSDGTVVATNTYDEYGVPAAGNQGRFQYTGQIWLPEVGLYHYKARAYSPTLGRFLQTDPIGYGDGLNWYAYVGNDPLNRRDPTGLVNEGCGTPGNPPCPPSPRVEEGIVADTEVKAPACNNLCQWERMKQENLKLQLEQNRKDFSFLCGKPSVGAGVGVDAYWWGGASVSGGGSINPQNGQISISMDVGVGVGWGGGVHISPSPTLGLGKPSADVLPILGAGINLNGTGMTPFGGVTGSYQLVGSNQGDYAGGYAVGAEVGGNVNVSGHVQINLPALYDLGCH